MNHDEILQAAKEAGFFFHDAGYAPILHTLAEKYSQMCFERFAAIIEKRTIERCEEECDYVSKNARASTVSYAYKTGADECAAAIRKLGEQ